MEPLWRRLLFLLFLLGQIWLAPVCARRFSTELFASIAVVVVFSSGQIYYSLEKAMLAPVPQPSFLATPTGQALVTTMAAVVRDRLKDS